MAGRGPVLSYSVQSVLSQTVRDLEVLIVGDGVCDATRSVIRELRAQDDRVRFFDFPEHPSRGEPNRHRVLTDEARGGIVCYLCDRDLYLPGHVERMLEVLGNADFTHTLSFDIRPDDSFRFKMEADLGREADRKWILRGWEVANGVPLSFAGHTMESYRRLPFGWRTTPPGRYTDIHMWEQFLAQPDCTAVSDHTPTVLYFPTYLRKGWSVEQRRAELERWSARAADQQWTAAFLLDVIEALSEDRLRIARNVRGWPSVLRHLTTPSNLKRTVRRIVRRLPF
ncbi:MAG: glycosyltransferase family 2 protein [Rhodothermales bacterium]|nr:glycosyltransferase family 2 protein [Rhodothermales bacterium]